MDSVSSVGPWDYVIVGAGSAGCTVASHLSSHSRGKCLLIEAGGRSSSSKVAVPAYYPHSFRSELDWNYSTSPQNNLANRRLMWPRGKGLGGSSLINAMIYLPGPKEDWLHLAHAWKVQWDALKKYLPNHIKSESALTETAWPIHPSPDIHDFSGAFLQAASVISKKPTCDFLESDIYTSGIFPRSQFAGRRVSAFHSLSSIAELNHWLSVKPNCQVSRILLKGNRAVGVEVISSDGTQQTIYARKALVLCAGTVESPALLLRSGIGSGETLARAGIACRHHLEGVGENLQDHLLLPVIFSAQRPSLASRFSLLDQQLYRWQGRGPMTSSIAEAGIFVGGDQHHPPHTQIHFTPTHYLEYPLRDQPTDAFTLGVTLLHPISRGKIAIQSGSVFDRPTIDPQYLSCAQDILQLKEGLLFARQIAETEPLKGLSKEELLPGVGKTNDLQIQRAIQAWVQTIYHPIGTCRVGEDSAAVVDHQFRVHGLEGLFIADASVLDRIPSCNPSAQVMALAGLAAERIAECS